jgi:2-polyprenyl-6-methoxyphenol hydroxylase-like FAD-dependent oxidoreductase
MNKFKVIIVGGGPVGLTTAHALHKAGIDFELLERREDYILEEGAGLAIGPQNLRVFHQLGLLDKLLKHGTEILQNKGFTANGRQFKGSWIFKEVSEKLVTFPHGPILSQHTVAYTSETIYMSYHSIWQN